MFQEDTWIRHVDAGQSGLLRTWRGTAGDPMVEGSCATHAVGRGSSSDTPDCRTPAREGPPSGLLSSESPGALLRAYSL